MWQHRSDAPGIWEIASLRFAVCGLRFAVCGLRFAVCGLRFAVCGLRFAVWVAYLSRLLNLTISSSSAHLNFSR
ncbi:hypothetical protein [Paenibacillus odorifer]|uniref:hypothetical protein n=1 Tax=Paenibacillus odorifer TaxID=189426 RepID=UPI00117F864C|nr:hypothetical protein [Paenibacillus odorifer]